MKEILNYLQDYLENNICKLKGELLIKNNGYDSLICDVLTEFEVQTNRYWDAKWTEKNIFIEFKKGKSIWLDLVRYSEMKRGVNDDAKRKTITLFFVPNNKRTKIQMILGMRTEKLISILKITDSDADFIIGLNEKVPRSLNSQASLTVNDIKKNAEIIIENRTQ